MTTHEGNLLIKEYMGLQLNQKQIMYDTGIYYNIEPILGYPYLATDTQFRFHSSFDWLMPVVEKIEKDFDGFILIHNKKCVINPGNLVKVGNTKIEAVWEAIIEFITPLINNEPESTEFKIDYNE